MEFLAFLHITEFGLYVLMAIAFMVMLAVIEIFGLKQRRSRAYRALLREARARRSEMHLKFE